MDAKCRSAMQLWALAASENPEKSRELASGVYFAVMDEVPDGAVRSVTNALDLCDLIQRKISGRGLTNDEKISLLELGQVDIHGAKKKRRLMGLFVALPLLVATIAGIAMVVRGFSWVLTGLAAFGLVWNSFARYMAGQGHSNAGMHIGAALLAMLACLVLSVLHVSGVFLAP